MVYDPPEPRRHRRRPTPADPDRNPARSGGRPRGDADDAPVMAIRSVRPLGRRLTHTGWEPPIPATATPPDVSLPWLIAVAAEKEDAKHGAVNTAQRRPTSTLDMISSAQSSLETRHVTVYFGINFERRYAARPGHELI
jgi:hypothetical protein